MNGATTAATITAIHCPSCGRWLMEAEAMKGARLRCKGCGQRSIADLIGGQLIIALDKEAIKG